MLIVNPGTDGARRFVRLMSGKERPAYCYLQQHIKSNARAETKSFFTESCHIEMADGEEYVG